MTRQREKASSGKKSSANADLNSVNLQGQLMGLKQKAAARKAKLHSSGRKNSWASEVSHDANAAAESNAAGVALLLKSLQVLVVDTACLAPYWIQQMTQVAALAPSH